jgi:hypothetical protein
MDGWIDCGQGKERKEGRELEGHRAILEIVEILEILEMLKLLKLLKVEQE